MKRIALALLLTILAAPITAHAQPPAAMSYQGVLTDGAGSIVSDGPYDLTFRLYNVSSGGVAIWTELHAAVSVVRGGFNVTLGATTPLDLPFDTPYWLGVSVGVAAELTPRTPLAASPYTLNPRMPIETEIDYSFGSSVAPGGYTYVLLQTFGSFTKVYNFTDIELTWCGHAQTGVGGVIDFCDYQIRVDGNQTAASNGRVVVYASATSVINSAFSTTALFHGLAAGSHAVSAWLRGTGSKCALNNGNFPEAIYVREIQQRTGVATVPAARVGPTVNGVSAPAEGR